MSGIINATNLEVANIKDSTGTNTAMTISSGGAITLPNQPTFSVIKNANQTITANQYGKCTWNVKSWDVGDGFDLANSKYQPSVSGYYSTTVNLRYDGSSNYTRGIMVLYKNGSPYKRLSGHLGSANQNYNMNGNCLVYLNGSSDYLEVWVYIGASTAVIGNTDIDSLCWWDGYKIG